MKILTWSVAFLYDCARLIVETFLRPHEFADRIARLNPPVPADFNLTQIGRRHLRDPGFWRLQAQGFAIPFAVIILGFALGLHYLQISHPRFTYTMINLATIILTVAFLVAITLRISIAIPSLVIFGMAMSTTWLGVYSRMNLATTNDSRAWSEALRGAPILLALGPFLYGLAFSVADHPSPGDRKRGLGADLGAAVLGGIVATASVVVLFFVPRLYHSFKFFGIATDCVVASVVVALLLGCTTYLQTRKVRPAVWIALGVVVFHTVATEVLLVNPATLSPFWMGARQFFGAARLQSLNVAYVIFAYAVARRLGGGRAGLMAALLAVIAEKIVYARSITPPTIPLGERAMACLPVVAGVLLGATQGAWRPILLYPISMAWNLFLWRADRERTQGPFRLGWHSAFWDQGQWLPLTGLDEHLLLVWERAPKEALVLERSLASGPQRWAALAARVELEARRFESCGSLDEVARVHSALPLPSNNDPKTRPLRDLVRLSHDLDATVARSQGSPYQYRAELTALSLRLSRHEEDWMVADHIFVRRMARVAALWRRIIEAQIDAPSGPHETELQSPYIIGMPLPARQDLFVGRHEIAAQIERLVGDPLQPPILLYGQRRMGKTSLLHNLGQRLPSHVLPVFVDLMGPISSSTDHAGFLCALARAIRRSAMNVADLALDPLPMEVLSDNPFLHFDTWLDHFDRVLETYGFQHALLALDEFETLAPRHTALDPTPILHLFRHILQHRRRFRLLFAGSHTGSEIEALSGFLINAQVLHLGRLTDQEARRLVEHPVPGFGLGYDVEAVDHVVTLTGCHPFLLQLLCRDIVAVKNHQPPPRRWQVTKPDVEEAIPPALQHGRMFFEDLAGNQVPEAVKHGLIHLARLGANATAPAIESDRDLFDVGLRREILEDVGTHWRFTIELVRRWFATAEFLQAKTAISDR